MFDKGIVSYLFLTACILPIIWKLYSIIRIFLRSLYNQLDLYLANFLIASRLNIPVLIMYLCQIILQDST